jgi:hypothetical protein
MKALFWAIEPFDRASDILLISRPVDLLHTQNPAKPFLAAQFVLIGKECFFELLHVHGFRLKQ